MTVVNQFMASLPKKSYRCSSLLYYVYTGRLRVAVTTCWQYLGKLVLLKLLTWVNGAIFKIFPHNVVPPVPFYVVLLQGFSFLLCLFTGILALSLVLDWPVEQWLQQLLKPSVVREDQLLPPPVSENVLPAPAEQKSMVLKVFLAFFN